MDIVRVMSWSLATHTPSHSHIVYICTPCASGTLYDLHFYCRSRPRTTG